MGLDRFVAVLVVGAVGLLCIGCNEAAVPESYGREGVLSFRWGDYPACGFEPGCALGTPSLRWLTIMSTEPPPPPTWFRFRRVDGAALPTNVFVTSSNAAVATFDQGVACDVEEVGPWSWDGVPCAEGETLASALWAQCTWHGPGRVTFEVRTADGEIIDAYALVVRDE